MAQNSPMEECICREDWVKSGGMGKVPQLEAYEKQAGWVKSGGMGKTPQYMSHADACVGYHAITW